MKIRIKRGLDVAIPGAPATSIDAGRAVRTVALVGPDYEGLAPALAVEPGAAVRCGAPLFADRRQPAVLYTAPASGRVLAIQRGERRRLLSVVIEIDDAAEPRTFASHDLGALPALSADLVRAQLLDSGLWTALRTRPFERVPAADAVPQAILVTAMDTNPHAADPAGVIAARSDAFAAGVAVVARLCERTVVCTARADTLPRLQASRVEIAEFAGPHPAGLPGTHVMRLAPVSPRTEVWHVGYQDVIAIGELFVAGRLDVERVVALGGPAVKRPRLLRTRLGAALDELLADEVEAGARIVSGSLLSGRAVTTQTAYLGRYATQVSAIPNAPANGIGSGMLPVESFERVWPHRAPVLPLLRALLIGDVDTARALGALSLAAEDLALCTYLCPARQDYGAALAATLAAFEAEAAA